MFEVVVNFIIFILSINFGFSYIRIVIPYFLKDKLNAPKEL